MSEATPLNLLVAFPYCKPRVLTMLGELGDRLRFLLDSGAFSAFNAGHTIELDEYCRFIETAPVRPWRYFNLDVIGDAEASARNYATMRERGLSPVPIFTRGAALDEIEEMYATSDLIGIGGLAIRHNKPYRYIKAVQQVTGDRPVHLLGVTTPEWIQYFHPYSCDSTSFNRAMRYGLMDVYLGQGEFIRYYSGRRQQGTHSAEVLSGPPSARVIEAVRGMGFDPYALKRNANWSKHHGVARWVSVCSWVRFAIDMERRWGTKLFLATAYPDDIIVAVACYRAELGEVELEAVRRSLIKEAA